MKIESITSNSKLCANVTLAMLLFASMIDGAFAKVDEMRRLLKRGHLIIAPNNKDPWFVGDYTEMPLVFAPKSSREQEMVEQGAFQVQFENWGWFARQFRKAPNKLKVHIDESAHGVDGAADGEDGVVREVQTVEDGVQRWNMALDDRVLDRDPSMLHSVYMKLQPMNGHHRPHRMVSEGFRIYRGKYHLDITLLCIMFLTL